MKKKCAKGFSSRSMYNETGNVMAVVLMIMALISIGGMSAIQLALLESYVVRNSAIYRQNLQLAEMAALEGLREILNERDPARLRSGSQDWIWALADWNDTVETGIPDSGYKVPQVVTENIIRTIEQRGETNADTLRIYFAGWTPHGSLNVNQDARWQKGKVIGVYNSSRYGRAWVEIGVLKKF